MNTPTTPRIEALFAKTKLLCFGRYAIRVPQEAELDWGYTNLSEGFDTHEDLARGDAAAVRAALKALLQEHWNKVRRKDSSAEVITVEEGPQPGGAVLWYRANKYDKEDETRRFYGVAARQNHFFSFKGMALKGALEAKRQRYETLLRNLRYRPDDEAPPREPGVCIRKGFVLEGEHQFQELFSVGIYLPSLPDVRFSVLSNKLASVTDGNEATLLQRIAEQKKLLGLRYPRLTTLREGPRTVNAVWAGEESLVRRGDGTHEFDWAFIGQATVSHPGQLDAKLYSKVARDRVGAAKTVSVSDAEALDLWDRLLGGLGFRVAVPGGPPGLLDGGGRVSGGELPAPVQVSGLRPGDVCPLTGMWRMSHPDPRVVDPARPQDHYVIQGEPMPGQIMAQMLKLAPELFSFTLVKALPRPEDKA